MSSSFLETTTNILCSCFNERIAVHGRRFIVNKLVAEGGFSFVYDVIDENGIHFAMKKIRSQNNETKLKVKQEIKLHKRLKHKNILELISFEEAILDGMCVFYLIMPLIKISLLDFLLITFETKKETKEYKEGNYKSYVSYKEFINIILGITDALEYIHTLQPTICHRDLKPGNVLLSVNLENRKLIPLLMDFGSAIESDILINTREEAQRSQSKAEKESSMSYRACELWDPELGFSLTTSSDLWSLGCIIYSMFFGEGLSPFESFINSNNKPILEACSYLKVISDISYPTKLSNKINVEENKVLFLKNVCNDLCNSKADRRPKAGEVRNLLLKSHESA